MPFGFVCRNITFFYARARSRIQCYYNVMAIYTDRSFIQMRDGNMRYLGLSMMARMAAVEESNGDVLRQLRKHQATILCVQYELLVPSFLATRNTSVLVTRPPFNCSKLHHLCLGTRITFFLVTRTLFLWKGSVRATS